MKKLNISKRVYRKKYMEALTEIQLYGVVAKLIANKGIMNKINEIAKEDPLKADRNFVWAVYDEMKLLDNNGQTLCFEVFEVSAPLSGEILRAKDDIIFFNLNIFQKVLATIFKRFLNKYPKYS